MKKIFKRKKLNNKGFTLIELLAVVVILAVVMGIAATSILSTMDKARGGTLVDTAKIVADAFNTKYSESLVDGQPTSVYKENGFNGYNFTSTAAYYIDTKLASSLKLSTNDYSLASSGTTTALDLSSTSTVAISNSFIYYDATKNNFVACLVAKDTGSNYVKNYTDSSNKKINAIKTKGTENQAIGYMSLAANKMMGCSDGTRSW